MEGRLHGRRRRRRRDRYRSHARRRARRPRQDRLWPGSVARRARRQPAQPRRERARDLHGGDHRGSREWRGPRFLRRRPDELPRRRAGRPHRERQGRRVGRERRCLPGDRRDRLGRATPQRQRSQHPGAQPLLRHRLGAALPGRPARVRGRAGMEGGHLRRRRHRERGLPVQDGNARRPGVRPQDLRRRRDRCPGHHVDVGRHRRVLLIDGEQRALRRRRQPRVAPREPARPGVIHRSDLRELRLRERRPVPWERYERGRRLHVW